MLSYTACGFLIKLSPVAKNGVLPVKSSYTKTPIHHISSLSSWPDLSII